jgi:hypothetical protein
VVEHLQSLGKRVEYVVFGDEGHDVLKFANRGRCFSAIEQFFRQHLGSSFSRLQAEMPVHLSARHSPRQDQLPG